MKDQKSRNAAVPNVSWWTIANCTWQQMNKDNVSALAAATAFYALLCVFPTLTALVSLYGLVADPTMVERQVVATEGILPPEAVKLLATWLQVLAQEPTARFGIGLLISVLLASWSAWSATGMLMTAVNICYGDQERRGFVRFNLEAMALSAGLVLFGVIALALVAVLPVLLNLLPVSTAWLALISLVRWPILAVLAIVGLAIVYRYAPARVPRKWEWVSWGAVIATALWLVGSIAFTFYVSNVGSYDKTYGSLGAVIILLLWFYISVYVILIGAELNAVLERQAARQ
ncbi:MAG TPA: YihY/virulence factor BrkB family protein [Stellaceae bacterium]|nr:YihY/virulence factor BrkB family protein [Stellaceae bacterium]